MSTFSSAFIGWAVTMPVNYVVAAILIATIMALFALLEVQLAKAFGLKEALINGVTDLFIVAAAVMATWIAVGYP